MLPQEIEVQGKLFRLRDLTEEDIPKLVSYWADASPEYIRSIGAEPRKVPPREKLAELYRTALPGAGPQRPRVFFVAETAEGHVIGYTNLLIKSKDESYAHVHILDPEYRGKGLAQALFPLAIQCFFAVTEVSKILLQTSPENERVNRLLQTVGLTPERTYLDNPDGMARPGAFNVYTLERHLFAPEGEGKA